MEFLTACAIIIAWGMFAAAVRRPRRKKRFVPDKHYKMNKTANKIKVSGSTWLPVSLPADFVLSEDFREAFTAIERSRDIFFITGNAGSGKSTLLQYFREKTAKKIAVVAPTGVAAVNVRGQTIHSFLHLPPRFIQKEQIRRLRGKAGELIEKLDALVIDEVSMVRADVMDGIDYALRINRNNLNVPFGGVQMILFGDLYQLPPVLERDAYDAFREIYPGPYFFDAHVFKKISCRYRELTRIYRQRDPQFIDLLNKIRHKNCLEEDLGFLNSRVVRSYEPGEDDIAIILTTTNNGASRINDARLSALPGKGYYYTAEIEGNFDEREYPAEYNMCLKPGAQVMLIRNDKEKRWVNGTLGIVRSLGHNSIRVDVQGKIYDVGKERWDKIRYVFNEEKQRIEDEITGAFTQYPLRLAWAITIHKSQGKTFDKVIIDLENGAFAHGQVYVALSRCRSLGGIVLRQSVILSDIIFDDRVYEFMGSAG